MSLFEYCCLFILSTFILSNFYFITTSNEKWGYCHYICLSVILSCFSIYLLYNAKNMSFHCNHNYPFTFTANDSWIVPRTHGTVVEGGFGHSSVYDPQSKLIYVYGGYHAGDTSSDQLSDKLYSFDITTRFWYDLFFDYRLPGYYKTFYHIDLGIALRLQYRTKCFI